VPINGTGICCLDENGSRYGQNGATLCTPALVGETDDDLPVIVVDTREAEAKLGGLDRGAALRHLPSLLPDGAADPAAGRRLKRHEFDVAV